jgi:hypothetical protein
MGVGGAINFSNHIAIARAGSKLKSQNFLEINRILQGPYRNAPVNKYKYSMQTKRARKGCLRFYHGIINYIDTNSKCRHLKKLTCKGTTLRQVFIRVYRLEIQSVTLVFSTQLCDLLPL